MRDPYDDIPPHLRDSVEHMEDQLRELAPHERPIVFVMLLEMFVKRLRGEFEDPAKSGAEKEQLMLHISQTEAMIVEWRRIAKEGD